MFQIRKYDFPDIDIFYDETKSTGYFIWVPDDYYVVLGNSNNPHENLIGENIFSDYVLVYRRPSGGETVVLTPNTLVISVKLTLEKFYNPSAHFRYFNEKIIEALSRLGIENLYYRGISDVAIGNKKILGSSIYRRRKVLFYHAVLNVSEDIETIERYIKHPAKEPDYRNGRTHHEFVTSLLAEGYKLSMKQITESLEQSLSVLREDEIMPLSGE
ncbi:MAG: lipoate--protein ligase family protein [Bacteroidota bacterium]